MKKQSAKLLILLWTLWLMSSCGAPSSPQENANLQASQTVLFTLKTAMLQGKMVYIGVGGEIDGLVNPDLVVQTGAVVRIVLINGDGMPHDLAIPDLSVQTSLVMNQDQTAEALFDARQSGVYDYYCTVAGHRQAGMEGKLTVK